MDLMSVEETRKGQMAGALQAIVNGAWELLVTPDPLQTPARNMSPNYFSFHLPTAGDIWMVHFTDTLGLPSFVFPTDGTAVDAHLMIASVNAEKHVIKLVRPRKYVYVRHNNVGSQNLSYCYGEGDPDAR
jgi:hypothetical protein